MDFYPDGAAEVLTTPALCKAGFGALKPGIASCAFALADPRQTGRISFRGPSGLSVTTLRISAHSPEAEE
jgi:hypothetical protein